MKIEYNFGPQIKIIDIPLSGQEKTVCMKLVGIIVKEIQNQADKEFLNIRISKIREGIEVIINYKSSSKNFKILEKNIYFAIGKIRRNI